ncbi:MAG: rhomboid family intramembrane serine protease [Planctomycetota bacterium]
MSSFSNGRNRSALQSIDETPLTYLFLIANLTVFALIWQQKGQLEDLGPYLAERVALLRWGAQQGVLLQDGQLWRLFSSIFVHIDFLHLGFNCFALWSFGPGLERHLGWWRYLVLYLVSGLCGSLLGALAYEGYELMAGGSGAIFGLIGALLAIALRRQRSSRFVSESTAFKRLLGITVAYLVIGFVIPFISGWGHLGGFAGGFVLLSCFYFRPFHPRDRSAWILRAAFVATLFAMTARALHPVEDPWYQWLRFEQAKTDEARDSWYAELLRNANRGRKVDTYTIDSLKALGPAGRAAIERRGLED